MLGNVGQTFSSMNKDQETNEVYIERKIRPDTLLSLCLHYEWICFSDFYWRLADD